MSWKPTNYRALTEEMMESLRRQFEDLLCVIVDEMSLLGCEYLYNIHRRLVEVMRNEEIFADKSVLLSGDLLQIPPTKQRAIYAEPKVLHNLALFRSDMNLWNSFENVHLLVNKRQGECPWKESLDRIRLGEMNDDDKKLLETRKVCNEEHKNKDYDDALHLFFSNAEVNDHNFEMITKLRGMPYKIKADIRGYPRGFYAELKNGFVEQTRMQDVLELKKGAKVILNFNTNISDSLVNGVTGIIIGFQFIKYPPKYRQHLAGAHLYAVIVKFNDPEIGADLRKLSLENNIYEKKIKNLIKEDNGVPIVRKTQFTNPPRFSNNAECCVEQIPLNLFYGSTIHKIQGTTLEEQDVVCYTHKYMKDGCGYVALSRCKNIENVYIASNFDFKKVKPHAPSLEITKQLMENCIAAKLKQKRFDIFYVNMRGKRNLINVRHDFNAMYSNLVCLVETNMNPQDPHEQWPERKCFTASCGRGSGVCAFVKNTEKNPYEYVARKINKRYQILQLKMKDLKTIDSLEVVQDKFQIFILYVSQDADYQSVANDLQGMLLENVPCIAFGDFNFDSTKSNPLSHFLTNVLQLQQIVTGPTYELGPNTIDHIYVPCNLAQQFQESSQFVYYSDHMTFTICFE